MSAKNGSGLFEDKTGLDRIVFFSDAVMAIAITLLVIDLKAPEIAGQAASKELLPALAKLWPSALGFVLSFAIIGSYWQSHHRLFRHVRRYDYRLSWLNLLFLFFIALLPFSTRLIGLYPGVRAAVVVYSANLLPLGIISYALMHHAYAGHRLVEAGLDQGEIKKLFDFTRRGTILFFVSLVISIVFPAWLFPTWFIGFAGRSIGRRALKIG